MRGSLSWTLVGVRFRVRVRVRDGASLHEGERELEVMRRGIARELQAQDRAEQPGER